MKSGLIDYAFILGGCIGGGGLPQSRDADILSKRIDSVYSMDERMVKRKSHDNEAVKGLYNELLKAPLSHISHKLLHTHYFARPRKPQIALKAPVSVGVEINSDNENVIYVVFGTQSGTAAQAAKEVKVELQQFIGRSKVSPEPRVCLVAGNAMPPKKLMECIGGSLASIFVTCTFGEGEFPSTMENLWKFLEGCDEEIFAEVSMRYAVFGLGSSMYAVGDQFNRAARRLDQRLKELGSERIVDVGLGDDQSPELYRGELDKWIESLTPRLFGKSSAEASYLDPPEPLFRLSVAPGTHGPRFRPVPPGYHFISLEATDKTIVSPGYDRPAALFLFDLTDTGLDYEVGDHLALLPRNPEEVVESVLCLYSPEIVGSKLLSVEAVDHLGDCPFPSVLTAKELLTQYLDICGRPSRNFFKQLFLFATTADSRNRLRSLFERDNPNACQEDFEMYTATNTYADVLCEFAKDSLPPFEYLLSMIPTICPRLYSIASSPLHQKNRLDLLVVLNKWKDPLNKDRMGLSTRYLFSADPGEKVAVQIRTGILQPPQDTETPIVMFGLGTGVAPFRGFLQDRQKLLAQGKTLGEATLYVGFRHKKNDFYFAEDYKTWVEMGVLTAIHPAFSHDDIEERGGKFYFLPDLIADEPLDVVRALQLSADDGGEEQKEPKVHVYYCGPAMGIPEMIQKAMEKAISSKEGGSMEEDRARTVLDRMIHTEDRFHSECF